MKKIKKKTDQKKSRFLPAFVVGYSHTDPVPPGYLAAWFDRRYGGPLRIRFINEFGHSHFEAVHTAWRVMVNMGLSMDTAESWKQRLAWSHTQVAEIRPLPHIGLDKKDIALHTARIARGITVLTEGTTYDIVSHSFFNPSDWSDHLLDQFEIEDHVRVVQTETIDSGQMWFYTLGLAKFGLEEIETFRPIGLPDQPVLERLLEIGRILLFSSRVAKVGEQLPLYGSGQLVTVVRHRTDQTTGRVLQLREVKWE